MTFRDFSQRRVRDLYGMGTTKNDFGIEIEIEGTGPLGVLCSGWNIHDEGSLRQPGGLGRGGAEYVTHGAISLDNVLPMIQRLNDTFAREGCVPDRNAHRTSVHIHLNVKELAIIDVLGYLAVFSAIEPLFLALCGEKRDGNAFCISSYETGDLPDYLNTFCKAIEAAGTNGPMRLHDRGKYASLSTFRLHDLGTLEVRCFPFSLDPQEIYKWCLWLRNIRDVVVNEPEKHFRQVIKQGIHDPELLIRRIFGPMSHENQNELVSFGSQEAYELTRLLKRYLNKTEDDYKKKKKKETESLGATLDAAMAEMPMPRFAPGATPAFGRNR